MSNVTPKAPRKRPKILIVDDDDALRDLLKIRLSEIYDVDDTSNSEHALELILQDRPDCILLDLLMPRYSGLELCQTLASLSFTQLIPVFILTGQSAEVYKQFCLNLGAKEFFEKPVDFQTLKDRLAEVLKTTVAERRVEPRIRLRTILVLRGTDESGTRFEVRATTDNVSVSGFSCSVPISLERDSVVDVALLSNSEQLVGRAKVVRVERHADGLAFCGFRITEKYRGWILD